MTTTSSTSPEPDRWSEILDRIPVGVVALLEFLVFGVGVAFLVLLVIPDAFGLETACVGPAGVQPTTGDTYLAGVVVLGTLGWLGAFLATIYAEIAERRSAVVLVPLVWSVVFVTGAVIVAAAVGPTPCPA